MTAISPTIYTGPLLGDGSQTDFPFTFSIIGASDIVVTVDGVAVPPTAYSVTFTAVGGKVTFATAPVRGARVLLLSNPDYLQTSEFENEGGYQLSTVNTINRRTAIKALVTEDKADRALKVPHGDGPGPEIGITDAASIIAVGENLLAGPYIVTVASAIGDVTSVATNIGVVGTVAGIAAQVSTVAAISGALVSVAGISAPVSTVAGISGAVTTVAGNGTDITTVAGISANITIVASSAANINTVAGNATNINLVGGSIANVNALAPALSSVATVAANLTSIQVLGGVAPSFLRSAQRVAPSGVVTEAKGQTNDTTTNALGGVWILFDGAAAVTVESYLTSFSVKHNTALAGRTVEAYIMRDQGGGDYKVIWASGLKAAAATGTTTIAIPLTDGGIMAMGDVIGVYDSAPTNADGHAYFGVPSATISVKRANAGAGAPRLTVGNNYGAAGYTTSTNLRPQIAYTTVSTSLFVTRDWLGAAFGVPALDSDARIKGAHLPLYAGKKIAVGDIAITQESGSRVFRVTKADVTDDYGSLKTASTFAFANTSNFAAATYNGAAPGFSRGGRLVEVSLGAGAAIPAGTPTLQLAVYRPRTVPPAGLSSAAITYDPVANLGEWPLTALAGTTTTEPLVFKDLDATVRAGDMLFVRGPSGFGFPYGTNTGGSHEYDDVYFASSILTDFTTAAFDSPFSAASVGAHFRLIHSVRIIDGPQNSAYDGPNSRPRTDSLGNLPASVARAPDLPLKGKKIALTGSSISTTSGGGNPTDVGHLQQAMGDLQCLYDNLAIGGSVVQWKTSGPSGLSLENQTIGATVAELTARFGAGAAQWSFENRLIGKGYDGVVMHDAINDTNAGGTFVVGAWGDVAPDSFYGVMTRMIDALMTDNPDILIWMQTPFHQWANYPVAGVIPTQQANRLLYRDACFDIALKFGLRDPIDYIGRVQCNRTVVKNGLGLYDVIHPHTKMKNSGRRVVYKAMRNG
ncbi:MAG: hypothetical protein V4564_04410 [Pseudomonadota bacterium]